jgi:hypothetical protein
MSDWIDPDARAQAARETFAALCARRLPTTTHTSLMERIAEYLDDHVSDDRPFDGLLGAGAE